jgi:hypothetical protein
MQWLDWWYFVYVCRKQYITVFSKVVTVMLKTMPGGRHYMKPVLVVILMLLEFSPSTMQISMLAQMMELGTTARYITSQCIYHALLFTRLFNLLSINRCFCKRFFSKQSAHDNNMKVRTFQVNSQFLQKCLFWWFRKVHNLRSCDMLLVSFTGILCLNRNFVV